MKGYSIYVIGFDDPYYCEAETASKARYRAFKAYSDAGYGRTWPGNETFRDFLKKITMTLHLGPRVAAKSNEVNI